MRRILVCATTLCWFMFTGVIHAAERTPGEITVFAAASLSETVQELAAAFQKDTGVTVRTMFASSATLARQIGAGAKADIFISADVAWMDDLEQHHLLAAGSRRNLVVNRLVLIAPTDTTTQLRLAANVDLIPALGGGRLALADPDSVPAGRYAKAAFTSFGVWQAIEPHVVRAADVRGALAWVATGEAPLGVVYATDARVESRVRVVDTFPESSHPPIVYPLGLLADASPAAARFASFLESPAGRAVFQKAGFGAP